MECFIGVFPLQPDGNDIHDLLSLSASGPFPFKRPSYFQNVKFQICTPYDMTNTCCFLMSFIMNSDIFNFTKFRMDLLVTLFLSNNNTNASIGDHHNILLDPGAELSFCSVHGGHIISVLRRLLLQGAAPCLLFVTPCPFEKAEMTPCPFD